jgi:hypothetical protein
MNDSNLPAGNDAPPRVLAGVMHCIEAEFGECLRSIEGQRGCRVEVFVVENLPNKAAHDALYRQFMQRAGETDFFVKVDADMVLESEHVLAAMAGGLRAAPEAQMATILVQDFFTDVLANGMHMFRNTVTWQPRDDEVFVDRCAVPPEQALRLTALDGRASHCKSPSPFQCFHFGVHKGVKFLAGIAQEYEAQMRAHWRNIERMHGHFRQTSDPRVGLACLGTEFALAGRFGPPELDYNNPVLKRECRKYESWTAAQLRRKITRLRWRNFDWPYLVYRREVYTDGLWSALYKQFQRRRAQFGPARLVKSRAS